MAKGTIKKELNKHLKDEASRWRAPSYGELLTRVQEQKKEIERLKRIASYKEYDILEAVQEFAEQLKIYASVCKEAGYDGIGENDIDEVLKGYMVYDRN